MITRMEVDSFLPGAPALPLGSFMPNNDPVQVRNIDGVGPVKSTMSSTPYATSRGELFQGSATGSRNIVLNLGLNPDWTDQTMFSLRQILYRYFMPENWVTLRFYTDELPAVYINGVVESFEPNLFSEDPEMQISIICPRPDFIDLNTTTITGTTGADEVAVEYDGTAPVGFELHISSASFSGDIEVSNNIGPYSQDMTVQDVHLDSGHAFLLNTIRTTRMIRLVRSTGQMNLLGHMARNSTWPEFSPGENLLVVRTIGSPGNNWTLGYHNRYGGL